MHSTYAVASKVNQSRHFDLSYVVSCHVSAVSDMCSTLIRRFTRHASLRSVHNLEFSISSQYLKIIRHITMAQHRYRSYYDECTPLRFRLCRILRLFVCLVWNLSSFKRKTPGEIYTVLWVLLRY